ncbi:hypothetical protein H4R20_004469 [Coemansia guatemalensis]|uniref:Thioesterase domain-containing protein n=1 Tax=Coemansia guatemalensis TaxID=2761395 RepID=A0A9W8LQH2_9FUNG|nr:hypothetical protein H4R20_004469 [Coemansia guatemalensis]
MNKKILHSEIQKHIDTFTDLVSVEFHSTWGRHKDTFPEAHMEHKNVMRTPLYWYSPSSRSYIGLWQFSNAHFSTGKAVQEMTLATLIDDVAVELAYRVFNSANEGPHVGVTVNLNIRRDGESAQARTFYFAADAATVSGRKVVVECSLFDALSGTKIMTARALLVFVPIASKAILSDKPQPISIDAGSQLPALDGPAARHLSTEELENLSQVMNFLPHGLIAHTNGRVDVQTGRLVVLLSFGKKIRGPPAHVHGGVLATVLNNASALLFSAVTGNTLRSVVALQRNVSYRKGMPIDSQNVLIDAVIESTSKDQIIIVAQLLRDTQLCTTLRTTFLLPKIRSSKL